MPRRLPQSLLVGVLLTLGMTATARADSAALLLRDPVLTRQERAELHDLGVTRTQATDHGHLLEFASAVAAADAAEQLPRAETLSPVHADVVTDDPGLEAQWGLVNRGGNYSAFDAFTPGVAGARMTFGADINAPMAWELARGAGVKVAVVDSGVDVTHRDLAGRIAADTPGYDFQDGQVAQRVAGGSHATHVAGIVAAAGGNGIATAGVAPEAAIVPVQVLDNATTAGTVATAYAGLDFAASQPGVRVVNVSLSTRNGTADVLCEPIARHPDVLFVTSAGNSGADTSQAPVFPAACPEDNVISVGASTRLDQRAAFSNYGATVDLFAPGEGILSLVLGDGDAFMSGTSMAAPFVSGAAALVLSARPELTPGAVRQAIMDSVDPAPALAGVSVSGGRLNAYAALLAVGATPMKARRTSAWHLLPAPALRFPSGSRLKLCARGSTTRGCRKVRTRSARLAPTMRGTVHLSLRRLGQAAAARVRIDKAYAVKGSAASDAVDFVVRTRERGRRLRPGRYRLTAVEHTRFGVTAPARAILKVVR